MAAPAPSVIVSTTLAPLHGEVIPSAPNCFVPDILGVDELLDRLSWSSEELAEWRTKEIIQRAEGFALKQTELAESRVRDVIQRAGGFASEQTSAASRPHLREQTDLLMMLNPEIPYCYTRLQRGRVAASKTIHTPKTDVRTFVSAPFENFKFEGDIINAIVVPTMRAYCQQLGLSFDLMTMRFGVNSPQNLEHQTAELCVKYVKACFDEGMGPAFVYLQGERVASPTFPSEVPDQYFRRILAELGRPRRELPLPWTFTASQTAWGKTYSVAVNEEKLLQEMWILDESTVPSVRRLRPKSNTNKEPSPGAERRIPVLPESWWEYSLDFFLDGERRLQHEAPRPDYARRVGLTTTGVEVDVVLTDYQPQLQTRAVRMERTIIGIDEALASNIDPIKAAAEVYKDAMSNPPIRALWQQEYDHARAIRTPDALRFAPQWVKTCVDRPSRNDPDVKKQESVMYPWYFRSSNFNFEKTVASNKKEMVLPPEEWGPYLQKFAKNLTVELCAMIEASYQRPFTDPLVVELVDQHKMYAEVFRETLFPDQDREKLLQKILNVMRGAPEDALMGMNDMQEDTARAAPSPSSSRTNSASTLPRTNSRPIPPRKPTISTYNPRGVYLITGTAGSGKSSLIARVINGVQESAPPQAMVVYRFLGATKASSDAMGLLRSIIDQIGDLLGGEAGKRARELDDIDVSARDDTVMEQFARGYFFAGVSSERPLIIILDALDQLIKSANDLLDLVMWLPGCRFDLPDHVSVICSSLPSLMLSENECDIWKEVKQNCRFSQVLDGKTVKKIRITRRDFTNYNSMPKAIRSLSLDGVKRSIQLLVESAPKSGLLLPVCHTLADHHLTMVSELLYDISSDLSPMSLSLLVDIAARWRSYQNARDATKILEKVRTSNNRNQTLLSIIFSRLEMRHNPTLPKIKTPYELEQLRKEAERKRKEREEKGEEEEEEEKGEEEEEEEEEPEPHAPNKFVGKVLCLLSVARDGLSLAELHDIVSMDASVIEATHEWWSMPLPVLPPLLVWRLVSDMGAYISRGKSGGIEVLKWRHRAFKDAVFDLFSAGIEPAREAIVCYFDTRGARTGCSPSLDPQHLRFSSSSTDVKRISGRVNARRCIELPGPIFENYGKRDLLRCCQAICRVEVVAAMDEAGLTVNLLEQLGLLAGVIADAHENVKALDSLIKRLAKATGPASRDDLLKSEEWIKQVERAQKSLPAPHNGFEKDKRVGKDMIRRIVKKLKKGERVEVNYRGEGMWYRAKIEQDWDGYTFSVRFDNANFYQLDEDERVVMDLIRRIPLQIGDHVEVNYRNEGTWYRAEIEQVWADGSFSVRFDDSDLKSPSDFFRQWLWAAEHGFFVSDKCDGIFLGVLEQATVKVNEALALQRDFERWVLSSRRRWSSKRIKVLQSALFEPRASQVFIGAVDLIKELANTRAASDSDELRGLWVRSMGEHTESSSVYEQCLGKSAITCVAWHPRRTAVAYGNAEGDIKILDFCGEERPRIIESVCPGAVHTIAVHAIAWTHEGDDLIISAGSETFDGQYTCTILSWKWRREPDPTPIHDLPLDTSATCLSIKPGKEEKDNQLLLAMGCTDGVVRVLFKPARRSGEANTKWEPLDTIEGKKDPKLTGGTRKRLGNAQFRDVIFLDSDGVRSVTWQPPENDGERLSIISTGGHKIVLWAVALDERVIRLHRYVKDLDGAPTFVVAHPQQDLIAVALTGVAGIPQHGGEIRLYDSGLKKFHIASTRHNPDKHDQRVTCLAWSPAGDLLISASEARTIKIWDATYEHGLHCLKTLDVGGGDVLSCVDWVKYSTEGMFLACGGARQDGRMTIFNLGEVARIRAEAKDMAMRRAPGRYRNLTSKIEGASGWTGDLSWSPDGRFLASASWDKFVNVWDFDRKVPHEDDTVLKHAVPMTLGGPVSCVGGVAWDPMSCQIASGRADGTILVTTIRDFQTDRLLSEFRAFSFPPRGPGAHTAAVQGVSWTSDGEYIASGAADKLIKIYRLHGDFREGRASGGVLVRTLQPHDDWGPRVSISLRSLAWSNHKYAYSKVDGTYEGEFHRLAWIFHGYVHVYRFDPYAHGAEAEAVLEKEKAMQACTELEREEKRVHRLEKSNEIDSRSVAWSRDNSMLAVGINRTVFLFQYSSTTQVWEQDVRIDTPDCNDIPRSICRLSFPPHKNDQLTIGFWDGTVEIVSLIRSALQSDVHDLVDSTESYFSIFDCPVYGMAWNPTSDDEVCELAIGGKHSNINIFKRFADLPQMFELIRAQRDISLLHKARASCENMYIPAALHVNGTYRGNYYSVVLSWDVSSLERLAFHKQNGDPSGVGEHYLSARADTIEELDPAPSQYENSSDYYDVWGRFCFEESLFALCNAFRERKASADSNKDERAPYHSPAHVVSKSKIRLKLSVVGIAACKEAEELLAFKFEVHEMRRIGMSHMDVPDVGKDGRAICIESDWLVGEMATGVIMGVEKERHQEGHEVHILTVWIHRHSVCMDPIPTNFTRCEAYELAYLRQHQRSYEMSKLQPAPPFLNSLIGAEDVSIPPESDFAAPASLDDATRARINDLAGSLNKDQRHAVHACLHNVSNPSGQGSLTLIQGPPGTGKTNLLGILLLCLSQLPAEEDPRSRRRKKILVCTPSNKAIVVVLDSYMKKAAEVADDAPRADPILIPKVCMVGVQSMLTLELDDEDDEEEDDEDFINMLDEDAIRRFRATTQPRSLARLISERTDLWDRMWDIALDHDPKDDRGRPIDERGRPRFRKLKFDKLDKLIECVGSVKDTFAASLRGDDVLRKDAVEKEKRAVRCDQILSQRKAGMEANAVSALAGRDAVSILHSPRDLHDVFVFKFDERLHAALRAVHTLLTLSAESAGEMQAAALAGDNGPRIQAAALLTHAAEDLATISNATHELEFFDSSAGFKIDSWYVGQIKEFRRGLGDALKSCKTQQALFNTPSTRHPSTPQARVKNIVDQVNNLVDMVEGIRLNKPLSNYYFATSDIVFCTLGYVANPQLMQYLAPVEPIMPDRQEESIVAGGGLAGGGLAGGGHAGGGLAGGGLAGGAEVQVIAEMLEITEVQSWDGLGGVDVLIVDEAAQTSEAELFSALGLMPKHLILIGDPQQLPAFVTSDSAQQMHYQRSAMERLLRAMERRGKYSRILLTEQYRMNPDILLYPNDKFYEGALQTADAVLKRLPEEFVVENPPNGTTRWLGKHSVFLSTTDIGGIFRPQTPGLTPHETGKGTSFFNLAEAVVVAEAVKLFHEGLTANGVELSKRLCIIAFHKPQVDAIQEQLDEMGLAHLKVPVLTVDSFQGSEADCIILSFARSQQLKWDKTKAKIGFLEKPNRVNVALTRARHKLIAVGNAAYLACSDLADFIDWHSQGHRQTIFSARTDLIEPMRRSRGEEVRQHAAGREWSDGDGGGGGGGDDEEGQRAPEQPSQAALGDTTAAVPTAPQDTGNNHFQNTARETKAGPRRLTGSYRSQAARGRVTWRTNLPAGGDDEGSKADEVQLREENERKERSALYSRDGSASLSGGGSASDRGSSNRAAHSERENADEIDALLLVEAVKLSFHDIWRLNRQEVEDALVASLAESQGGASAVGEERK